ncbi:MAG TPA: hypothetical protein VNI20_08455 [Fimbriimonadaceae bacterium]|nr:hypothetical protein [Fimbriimonadaceae bacterium]
MKNFLATKNVRFVAVTAALAVGIAGYVLFGVIMNSHYLGSANDPASRKRPVVGQKTRTYNEIVHDVKMNPDQAEKFLIVFTKYKDEFVNARRKGQSNDEEESAYLQKTIDNIIANSKPFLTDEQFARLKSKLGS